MSATQPDSDCRRCPRLVALRERVRRTHPEYHGAPVPAFGPTDARLLIVGLAPGLHGAHATGRPFTGDTAGTLLYKTLFEHGFASRPMPAAADDALELYDCRITNAVKCLPPGNKPVAAEIGRCNAYLRHEILGHDNRPARVVVALGGVAHRAVIRALALRQADWPFAHAATHALRGDLSLIDSYHCSRYNTQTRRLTPPMFADVFRRARRLLAASTQ